MEMQESHVSVMRDMGFSSAIIDQLLKQTYHTFPLRWWILDNSGSMLRNDGRRLVETQRFNDVRWVETSRWNELRECAKFHAQMAQLLQSPTKFTILNASSSANTYEDAPLTFQVGMGQVDHDFHNNGHSTQDDVDMLHDALQQIQPGGCTPLAERIKYIHSVIESEMEQQVRNEGKRIVVVIATDGVPTDGNGWTSKTIDRQFEDALHRLQQLPVWIVVRLCTGDDSVVSYYESLDSILELNLEVLDDFESEAKQVYSKNPWLNYGLPLHRIREMGFSDKLLDLLDERQFTLDEVVSFCRILLWNSSDWPDPHMDWNEFIRILQERLELERKQFNVVQRRVMPWIDVKRLERIYGPYATKSSFDFSNIIVAIIVAALGIVLMAMFTGTDQF